MVDKKELNKIAHVAVSHLLTRKNNNGEGEAYTAEQISKFCDALLPNKIREFIATDDKLLNKAKLLLRITKANEEGDLKFNIGKNTDNAAQCVNLVQNIHNSDMKTRLTYHIKDQNESVTEEKIEQFIKNILYEFYEFITTEFTGTVDNYIDILSKCEENNLSDIVEALLPHRSLFYMPKTNILHPSALKLLDKYKQTMAPEDMANNKNTVEVPELPDVQSAIELLGKLVLSDN